MTLKLYGSKLSTCTRCVTTVLYEKNIPFELVPIDFKKGEHKSPEFIAKQPWGKVPVLEDDGFLIFESRAICKYIAKKYAGQGTKLIPDDGDFKGYALFEQASSMEYSYFDPAASTLAFEKFFKPNIMGLDPDEKVVAFQAGALDTALAGYETVLSKQPYLAGSQLTVVDIFHLPYGQIVKEMLGYEEIFAKYPAVNKWFNGLLKLESWAKANAA